MMKLVMVVASSSEILAATNKSCTNRLRCVAGMCTEDRPSTMLIMLRDSCAYRFGLNIDYFIEVANGSEGSPCG